MDSWKRTRSRHMLYGAVAVCLSFGASATTLQARTSPQYNHIFLVLMETEEYGAIIGNQYAPILNALAQDYGLATNYRGVGDPSEPNYIAMLGGDTFGTMTDDDLVQKMRGLALVDISGYGDLLT